MKGGFGRNRVGSEKHLPRIIQKCDTRRQRGLVEMVAAAQLIEVCRSRASHARSRRATAVVERALLQTGVELSSLSSGAPSDALCTFHCGANDQQMTIGSARALVRWCPAILWRGPTPTMRCVDHSRPEVGGTAARQNARGQRHARWPRSPPRRAWAVMRPVQDVVGRDRCGGGKAPG